MIQQFLQNRAGQGAPQGQPPTMPGQGPLQWTGAGRAQWGQQPPPQMPGGPPQGQVPMQGSLGQRMQQGIQNAMGRQQPPQMPGGPPQGAPPTQQGMRGQMQQFAQQGRDPMGNVGGMLRAATMLRKK